MALVLDSELELMFTPTKLAMVLLLLLMLPDVIFVMVNEVDDMLVTIAFGKVAVVTNKFGTVQPPVTYKLFVVVNVFDIILPVVIQGVYRLAIVTSSADNVPSTIRVLIYAFCTVLFVNTAFVDVMLVELKLLVETPSLKFASPTTSRRKFGVDVLRPIFPPVVKILPSVWELNPAFSVPCNHILEEVTLVSIWFAVVIFMIVVCPRTNKLPPIVTLPDICISVVLIIPEYMFPTLIPGVAILPAEIRLTNILFPIANPPHIVIDPPTELLETSAEFAILTPP